MFGLTFPRVIPGAFGSSQRRAGRSRDRVVAVVLALLLVLAGGRLGTPDTALGAGGLSHTAVTTYTVKPDAGRLDVVITLSLKNTKRGYYFYGTGLSLETGATNVRVKASAGTASIKRADTVNEYWNWWEVRFSNLLYGQSRRLTVSYQLPGGAPRSDSEIRVGEAYAAFCATGNGQDSGSVRVVTPPGFSWVLDMQDSQIGSITSKTAANGTVTWSTKTLAEPSDYWVCFSGYNESGYASTTVTSAGGREIRLEFWPEDLEWRDQVSEQMAVVLEELESLLGQEIPASDSAIAVREVSSLTGGYYAGGYSSDLGMAWISEHVAPGIVAHELSHIWLNGDLLRETWILEGMAQWAEATIAHDPCATDPGSAPTRTQELSTWTRVGPRATAAELRELEWQYEAACFVVSSLAVKAGDAGMRAALAALLGRTFAYRSGDEALVYAAGPADWKRWLDAVDELGLVPAGVADLDYAQQLLVRFGAATETGQLGARSEARARYHELEAQLADWTLPAHLLRSMSYWDFSAAMTALGTSEEIWATVNEAAALLPESAPLSGPVRSAFQQAATQSDLDAAKELALTQETAARLVAAAKSRIGSARPDVERLGLSGADMSEPLAKAIAEVAQADLEGARATVAEIERALAQEAEAAALVLAAKERVDGSRDFLSSVGLIGADLAGPVAAGVAAVEALDVTAAAATATSIQAIMDDASQQGLIRIAILLGLLAAGVVAFFLVRRRYLAGTPPTAPSGDSAAGTTGPGDSTGLPASGGMGARPGAAGSGSAAQPVS